jgi:hypothetical protein
MTNRSVTTTSDHRVRGSGELGVLLSRRSVMNILVKSSVVAAVAPPCLPFSMMKQGPNQSHRCRWSRRRLLKCGLRDRLGCVNTIAPGSFVKSLRRCLRRRCLIRTHRSCSAIRRTMPTDWRTGTLIAHHTFRRYIFSSWIEGKLDGAREPITLRSTLEEYPDQRKLVFTSIKSPSKQEPSHSRQKNWLSRNG